MLFSKAEYEEIMLPFRYVQDPDTPEEAGIIDIEAYGNIFGEEKYCFASYSLKDLKMYENGDYEKMVELLKNSSGRSVKVIIKLKNGIPKDFKIDIDSLADAYYDDRFKALELGGWGFNDKSAADILKNN